MRRGLPAATCTALLVLAGCGGGSHYKNDPRPPAPLDISASILPDKVSVSPVHFGAGPISLTVANLTGASQRISIVKRINGQNQRNEQTGPINPHDTATLQADVDQGDYVVQVEGASIKPARLTVGKQRASAQNDLLQP
ncbi:MAG: hypothetical protein JWM71_347 [Solirubrobacteraceae bacterium]|nr:hypothetical protein [Solirubrobacteraceae bacterium]